MTKAERQYLIYAQSCTAQAQRHVDSCRRAMRPGGDGPKSGAVSLLHAFRMLAAADKWLDAAAHGRVGR